MTIKTKFQISIVIIVIFVFSAGFAIYQISQRVDQKIKKSQIANELVSVATSRRGLLLDYLLYREERPKAQWQLQSDAVIKLTQDKLFKTQAEKDLMREINETSEEVKSIFIKIVANYEKSKFNQDLEQALAGQLLLKTQMNISRAYKFAYDSLANIKALRKLELYTVAVSVAALLFFIAMLFLFFNRIIAVRLRELIEGTDIIARGNWDHKIAVKNPDEIGLLAQAFNKMEIQIKKSYAIVEKKVHDRTKNLKYEKKLAENLARDLEKFKMAAESTSDMVIISDIDGITIYANPATEVITGFTNKEIIGKKCGSLWGNYMKQSYYKKLWETIKIKKKTFIGHFKNKRKNGEIFDMAFSISPVLDKKGNVLFFVDTARDITKEVKLDKAKTELVALASHQLRTPLSTVNWYTEMLLAGDVGKLNVEQQKYLNEIYKGNKRMVDLVNAFLNVSRFELGISVIEPKTINVINFIKDIIEEQKPQIKEKKLKLNEKYIGRLPLLKADPKLLLIIFQNLLSNAIKCTPEKGKITLELSLSNLQGQVPKLKNKLSYILVKISDTGYGIPKVQQNKIFSKLFRADNVREKNPNGTGLGLYIVKSIIDQIGGMIWFLSKENKWTTFYVTLPLVWTEKKAD